MSVLFSRPSVSILMNTRFRYPRVDASSSPPPSPSLLLHPHLLAEEATKKLIAAAPFASSRPCVVCVCVCLYAPRIHSYTTRPCTVAASRFLRKKITQYETRPRARQRNPPGGRKTCVQCVRRREERFLDCLPFGSFLEGWHAVTYRPLFGVTVCTVFCVCVFINIPFFRIPIPPPSPCVVHVLGGIESRRTVTITRDDAGKPSSFI